jgi:hypothetical protein
MSYARFGLFSDVHVLEIANAGFACLKCKTSPPEFRCTSAGEMAAHLREHQKRGDKVPAAAILELEDRHSPK